MKRIAAIALAIAALLGASAATVAPASADTCMYHHANPCG